MYKIQFKEDGFILEGTDKEMACIFIFVPYESVQFSIIMKTKFRIILKQKLEVNIRSLCF